MNTNRPEDPADPNDADARRSSDRRSSSRSGKDDKDNNDDTAAFGFSFVPGAPQPPGEEPAEPNIDAPSDEPVTFGLDPDHGIKSDIPIVDTDIPIPIGEDIVPVKSIFGLTLKGWAAIGGIAVALLGGGLGIAGANDDPGTGRITDYDPTTASGVGDETTGDSWETYDPVPGGGVDTTEYVEPEPDPIAEAAIGECYYVYGDDYDAEIEWAACEAGAFEVIDIAEGTTDLYSCDWIEYANQAVTSTEANRVLCLAYIVVDGDDAFRAVSGECVYGIGDVWNITGCDTGEFRVLERIEGVGDSSYCDLTTYGSHSRYYTTPDSYMDVTLCLEIVYPDDIGYAEQYTCLWTDGDDYFEFSDCDSANARVVGRTNAYDAAYWCDGYGWSTWTNYDYPEHAYTVCWEWY